MATFSPDPIDNQQSLIAFEKALPFEKRLAASSIYDLFEASAAKYPDRVAITMLMTGAQDEQPRQVKYAELIKFIRRAANLFFTLGGARPGVAYMLPSLVETHVSLWAAETAGFAVPINFLLQADHIAELIRASGAKILVTIGPHPQLDIWEKALQVKQQLPELQLVRVAAPDAEPTEHALDFYTGLMAQPDDHLIFGAAGSGDEVAAYFHTGGTTGAPKLVAHTHRNQIVAAYGGSVMLHLSEQDTITNGFPLFHVAGTIAGSLSFFMIGAQVLILSPAGLRNPAMIASFWKIVEKYRVTIIAAVPTAIGALVEAPLNGADLSHVRLGICGAASMPRAVAERFEQITGKKLHEILGMTESAGLISIDLASGDRTAGSVGYALPYTEVVIKRLLPDGSLGESCLPNEIGVLTVSGPTVSTGYLNPQQNKGVFAGGVLNSGDLAYKNEEGCIFIAGRSKDLIIRSGHNIDPAMIENVMTSHPAVALAAAVAQPDRYAGELPVCYVSLRPGMTVSAEELQRHAEQHIAERPAWPKHIFILDGLPLTSIGKIFKPALRLDAARHLVKDVLLNAAGLHDVAVDVHEGGPRGLRVTISLTEAQKLSADAVREAFAGFVFETIVDLSKGQ